MVSLIQTTLALTLLTVAPRNMEYMCREPARSGPRMNFEEAFALTLTWEGGDRLHTVPGDPGGTTKYGISQRAYPEVDVEHLTLGGAQEIARRDYWSRNNIDFLPAPLRWYVFDTAFNMGSLRAGRLLQTAINLCIQANPHAMDFLSVDGEIGPRTISAAHMYEPARLLRVLRAYRMEYYLTLGETGYAKFLDGWLRRAEGRESNV